MHAELKFDENDIDSTLTVETLTASLRSSPGDHVKTIKNCVETVNQTLKERYRNGADVEEIVFGRARYVDIILSSLFTFFFEDNDQKVSLIAVGGYGRGELHPGSDIDLMLLLEEEESDATKDSLEKFLTALWDGRLEIGQSVRTLDECIDEAEKDITVVTNLIEARLLAGDETIYDHMKEKISTENIWDASTFFKSKLEEQIQRSGKFNDTAFNLEPNIKESHGGLRDIQMIGWVAKRHFGATNLHDLVDHGFLQQSELDELLEGQHLLWRIRCSLHFLAGRREDRLLFDYQRTLAEEFGYTDDDQFRNFAIEQFMQQYYRTVMKLERLNEMLLQLFREDILHKNLEDDTRIINNHFQIRHGYVEVVDEQVFKESPSALLELFYVMQQYPEIQGVRAETIRLVKRYRYLIDEDFRNDKKNSRLFINIMRQNRGITHELRRMNRYGILAAYIPAFDSIVGRMQYDLFHAYTVDQHTLFVVRNLRRFAVPEFCHEFPLASGIIHHLKKPELLYLAGLFHDIAKGRNGDHSELGAVDAYEFCIQHDVSEEDAQLVSWLVKSHLIMSMTAQSKDISDPEVILEFAHRVGDIKHLDYLYLLTIADIRGTNPQQWNSWKDKLLVELYNKTAHALRIGLEHHVDKQESILHTQTDALRLLETSGMDPIQVQSIWSHYDDEYFLRQTADEITWHTISIYRRDTSEDVVVETRYIGETNTIELFVYLKTKDQIFANITTVLGQLELNVADAQIMNCENGYSIETFVIHFDNRSQQYRDHALHEIKERIHDRLTSNIEIVDDVKWRQARVHKHFDVKTVISFEDIDEFNVTRMHLETSNRQGLLAIIAKCFLEQHIKIRSSRISTVGERAIDYFDITCKDTNEPLSDEEQDQLKRSLIELLD